MEEPTNEPTPTSVDNPGGDWIAPSPDTKMDRVIKLVAVAFVLIILAAFLGGFVYGFAGGDPDAPFVLPWEQAPGTID